MLSDGVDARRYRGGAILPEQASGDLSNGLDESSVHFAQLPFDEADIETTKVEVVQDTNDQPFFQVGYSSFIDDPSPVAVYRRRPPELVRRRTNRLLGHAPRRACNQRQRGSRRVTRVGPSSSDDPPGESDQLDARAAL